MLMIDCEKLIEESKALMKESEALKVRCNRSITEFYALTFDMDRPKMKERDLIGCLLIGCKLPFGKLL